jgi:chromosome segregation ATPase|tara:strand:- start:3696 stop:4646 length:951 start_codon:yes stop_codon:yes gene_type:complete
MEKSEEQLSLNLENKNELTVFDQVKHELDIQRDPMEFKVPLSDIFGKTSLAPKSSFGQVTFKENIEKVDLALANTEELQNIWNHSHTQWMWRHINLSWLSPYKNMRQIAAEIARKKAALNEAKWRHIQNELKIKKIEEELANPEQLTKWREIELNVKLAQLREGLAEGAVVIEGAMKDVLALNELYEQLKNKVSDFSEEDVEAEETKTHLKRSIVQCIRDVRQSGSITKGEQEYMEQIGVNPSKLQRCLREFVRAEEQSDKWDVTDLYTFVDELVKELIENHKVDIKRMELQGFNPEYIGNITYNEKVAHGRDNNG